MAKYKIKDRGDGYIVMRLTEYFLGYAWDQIGSCFQTRDEAEDYIRIMKEGEKYDSITEGSGDQTY